MNSRVTQTDIARVAGVHNTTVSLALRNHPALPEKTRTRIQAIARELGYCPDPALQALAAYRISRMPRRTQGTIAYVTNWHSKWGWQDDPASAQHFQGAQRKAGECGFQLEHFWLGAEGMSSHRLDDVLFNRGITGILLAAHRPDGPAALTLDWSRFSVVKIGSFPLSPPLHRVVDDPTAVMRTALQAIAAAGYHRVGFVLPRSADALADGAWSAAFAGEHARRREAASSIAPLLYGATGPATTLRSDGRGDLNPIVLQGWLQRFRPDVVVSLGTSLRPQFDTLELRVPGDVSYVDLSLAGSDGRTAGVRENHDQIGEQALALLVNHLQQNLRGLPAAATTTILERIWSNGESLPSVGWAPPIAFPTVTSHDVLVAVP